MNAFETMERETERNAGEDISSQLPPSINSMIVEKMKIVSQMGIQTPKPTLTIPCGYICGAQIVSIRYFLCPFHNGNN